MATKIIFALFAVLAVAAAAPAEEKVRAKKDIIETVVTGYAPSPYHYYPYAYAPVHHVSRIAYATPYVTHVAPIVYLTARDNGQYYPGKYGPEHQ